MARNVLYLHGFASSPQSAKILLLRPLLVPFDVELDTPDLNVPSFEKLDFPSMAGRAIEHAERHRPDAIAGSSLGALVALAIARQGFPVPLVLLAPALGIGERWKTRLPEGDPVVVWNHARNAETPIHRRFFDQMNDLAVDRDPPPARTTVVMGRHDETVPFDLVEETWQRWEKAGLAKGSRFITLDEGDHGLTAYGGIIAQAIADATRDLPEDRTLSARLGRGEAR